MEKRTCKILFIITLIFCVLSIAVTILASSMLTIPNKKNTKELVVTFVSAEKPMSLMYYVKINEYNSRLIIHNETIADLDVLQELNSGDCITVRVLTAKSKTIKHGSVEIVEMKKADKVIVSLEKSREFTIGNRRMILPVGIVFFFFFAVVFVISLCGYKDIFKRK